MRTKSTLNDHSVEKSWNTYFIGQATTSNDLSPTHQQASGHRYGTALGCPYEGVDASLLEDQDKSNALVSLWDQIYLLRNGEEDENSPSKAVSA